MNSLFDKITDWLKEMLVGGIMDNLSGLFDSVNDVYCIIKFPKVAEAIPQSCRGNFPNNAAVFGASLSLFGR